MKDWLGGSWLDIWGAAFLDEVKWGSEVEGSESECWVEQAGGGGRRGGAIGSVGLQLFLQTRFYPGAQRLWLCYLFLL